MPTGRTIASFSATPCRSVAHALAQAASGDEIKIAIGLYTTNARIDAPGTITLSGGWRRDFLQRDPNPRRTCLGGLYRDRVLVLEADAESIDVTLDRLTIAGGEASTAHIFEDTGLHGGGILVAARNGGALTLTLRQVMLRKNETTSFWSGAGLGVWSFDTSSVSVHAEDSEFAGNFAQRGAAIDVVGPGSSSISAVRSVFKRNRTRLRGGAIALDGLTDPSATHRPDDLGVMLRSAKPARQAFPEPDCVNSGEPLSGSRSGTRGMACGRCPMVSATRGVA